MQQSIFVVIVLYKIRVADCLSLQSFLYAVSQLERNKLKFHVLLYDNSPEPDAHPELPPHVSYLHDASNSGLATAYNYALRRALAEGYEWLLTFDQDTSLPPDGLPSLCATLMLIDGEPDVAAVVPQVRSSGRIVSPHSFSAGWARWFPDGYTGIPEQPVFAFNSGSLLRVRALRQVGGYSPWFWLDCSDLNLHRQLAKLGKQVYIAGNIELGHDFSMLNMQAKVSPARYETMLLAESALWDLEMSQLAGLVRTIRLAYRMIRHVQRGDSPELRWLTRREVMLRLFWRRRRRLARWRRITGEIIARFPQLEPLDAVPRISVCMAVHNGARYLREQLDSIWPQLGPLDELVIVNDASTDETGTILEQFRQEMARMATGPQVVLVRQNDNRGMARTFEHAVRGATGDILFISDFDDRWHPDKVAKTVQAFVADPAVQIVCTGLTLIDENNDLIARSDFLKHRKFSAGLLANLLHNQFQGSAMALRSSVLWTVLPFPPGKLFLYDAWIGVRNALFGGKVAYIEEPLLFYRRHSTNASQRLSRWNQIRLRLQLIRELLRASMRTL